MDLLESIFSDPKFKIPVEFGSDDFKTEVDTLLTIYIRELEGRGVSQAVLDSIKKFRRLCGLSLKNYLKGIHSNAYKNFEHAVKALHISNSKLLKASIPPDASMYRARENRSGDVATKDYKDEEMFHIPLDSRRIISTQRYSFPGLPCLYLGASVYTCWVELNRPAFEDFQVAAIATTPGADGYSIVDMSNIPQRLPYLRKELKFTPEEYLLYWPLLALCSIKVRNESGSFKPEYIFPQFLLEYIQKNQETEDIVGVKYVSIKAATVFEDQLKDDWHTYVNYVFPVRSDEMIGKSCKLLERTFKIDNNYSGRDLQILTRIIENQRLKSKIANLNDEGVSNWRIYTKNGDDYSYQMSIFGLIEEAMQHNQKAIENNNDSGLYKDDVATPQPIRLAQKDVDLNIDELNREKPKTAGNGWDNTTGKWRYLVNGSPITDEWKSANGKWFYLDTDGNMVTDKLIEDVNGPIYYVNKYGAMVTETWKAVAFEEGDEVLVRDADYWWMYFGSDGKAYKCKLSGKYVTRDIKGKKYAFDENGHMLYGWIDKGSSKLLDSDPCAWQHATYYFGDWNDGAMTIGQRNIVIAYKNECEYERKFIFDQNGEKID